jgi:hypothetical protein
MIPKKSAPHPGVFGIFVTVAFKVGRRVAISTSSMFGSGEKITIDWQTDRLKLRITLNEVDALCVEYL